MSDFAEINERFKEVMRRAKLDRSELAVTQCLIAVGGYAATMTPQATGTLINSQYRKVEVTVNGVSGEVGFGASYARFVHDAPGKYVGQNKPRYPKSDGVLWAPGAEPGFLLKGVRMMIENNLQGILRSNYTI